MGIDFRHRIGRLDAIRAQIINELPHKVTKQWGYRYMGFIRKRFDVFSKGGGDWPELAPSTIAGRRFASKKTIGGARQDTLNKLRRVKNAKNATAQVRRMKKIGLASRKVTILRDTGTLFAATRIGNPGNLFHNIHKGVRVGFAGAKSHPSGKATLAEIATFHNRGGKHLPRRQILVPPDDATMQGMLSDYKRAMNTIMRGGSLGGGS